jgi:protein-disulfide isomerase
VYEVPDEQFAISLPPTWGNVDMDSTLFTASLQAAMAKYPDVASTIQGEAYSLINAGVHFFGFDPTSEAMRTGSTTDASVQRQTMGSEATLAQIEQLVRTQLSNAPSVKQPVSTRIIGLAAGGESLEVSFTATVSGTNGSLLDLSVFQYLTLRDTDVYVVTLSTNENLSGGYASAFQGIAASLKFLPPKRYEVSLDDDPVKGSSDALVTIVEFSEFECPYCGVYSRDTFPQIDEAYIKTGKVKYVFRDFPLSFHEHAQKAAEAAGCAGEQGKFWEYHDKLFANQSALTVDNLKQYAKDLGLDTAKFDQCLDSGVRAAEVAKDVADAQNYRVSSTPTFFINGIKLKGAQSFSAFQELIEAELAKK